MTKKKSKGNDALGIRPAAKAFQTLTTAAVDVLNRICLPAAEELGLLIRDRVSWWRASNLRSIMKKLEKQLAENKVPTGARAHPRLVHAIVEQGSLADDSDIQDLWAGLLSSSCTPSGDDDSNLIFIDLLNGLTRLQAKILKYACEQAPKSLLPSGLIVPGPLPLSIADLRRITEEDDIHRLDRELDRLRTVGLLDGGIATNVRDYVNLTPSSLALQMYIRCQGSRVSPAEFFRSSPPHPSSAEPPNLAQ